jgi:nitrite reductase/ring-hydroxylating ferredoxin subunit
VEEVECTCHGSKFNIKTGVNTAPPAAENLPTYQTKIEGDDVYVEVT